MVTVTHDPVAIETQNQLLYLSASLQWDESFQDFMRRTKTDGFIFQ